jgi:HK97 family phage portal protein
MSLWDRVTRELALNPMSHLPKELTPEPPPVRMIDPGRQRELSTATLEERIGFAFRERQGGPRPWRRASVDEALGVPAFLSAVTMISNLMGIFTLQAFQNGERVADADRPRLIVRPNPFTTLRDYLRETGWSMATRGENWQWIAARDIDNQALSVIPVPSREVAVSGDWLSPSVKWRNVEKTRDFSSVFLTKELGALRGRGPLQYCGAAISAAVESQEWAANFYALGGNPSVHIHSEDELSEAEAATLREKWTETPPNMPQVTSGPITAEEMETNGPAAQMLDARNWNAGEAARAYQIPGPLLEYSRGGSSLSYSNVVTLFDQLLKQCVIPNYLEPVEQMLSDLLPRSWVCRFNVDAVLRADIKTRFEVYKTGLETGVYPDVSIPQQIEGIAAGSVENAPAPPAPPSALPASVPKQPAGIVRAFSSAGEPWRCSSCKRLLAEVRGEGTQLRCRCGALAIA